MIRTVSDLKRALDAYPDDLPITIWDTISREHRAPFIMEEDGSPSLEPVGKHDPADVVLVRMLPDRR